jgi:MFS family permease
MMVLIMRESTLSRIPRNVLLLGLVSLFTDMSSEMLYPITPIFLTKILGASPAIVGIIEGAAESTASLLKIWSGWLSDRRGVRRPFVLAGYGISALTRPMLAMAYGWPMVLAARVLDRFGKGIRGAPRDALIADSVDPEFRGRAFGFHRSMDQTGAVIGPLIGMGLLAAFHDNLRWVFLIAFIPSAISTLIVLIVRDRKRPVGESAPPRLTFAGLSPQFRHFLVVVAIFSIGNSSDVFLILRAQQLGYSATTVIGMFALFNIVYVLSAYPAGILSDRIPRRFLFTAGLVIFALVYAGFAVIHNARWLWGLFPIYGLYMGLTDGVSRAIVSDLVDAAHRGSALGLHAAVLGFAAFPASAAAGVLWSKFGPPAPFYTGALCAFLAAMLAMRIRPGTHVDRAMQVSS